MPDYTNTGLKNQWQPVLMIVNIYRGGQERVQQCLEPSVTFGDPVKTDEIMNADMYCQILILHLERM